MNLFKYLNTMKELDSVVAYVGAGLLALFLVVIILKMLTGLRRGTGRQLVHTLLTVGSAVISIIVSVILSNGIVGSLSSNTFGALVDLIEIAAPDIGSAIKAAMDQVSNPEVIEYIVLLPAALFIIPLFTTIMFLIINTVFKIVYVIVIKILGLKKAKTSPQRLGGAVLAALEALLWMMILVLPINGALSLVDNVFETALESNISNKAELEEIYDEYLVPFTKNPAFNFLDVCGSEKASDAIATVKINESRVNLRDEVVHVTHFVLVDVTDLLDADLKNPTAENKEEIKRVIDAFCESEFMSSLMVGVVQTVATAIDNDTIPLNVDESLQPIIDETVGFFRNVSTQTLKTDLYTINDLYFEVCNSGIMTAMEEGQDILGMIKEKHQNGTDIVTSIKEILQSNPRTSGMVTAITKALVTVIIPEDATIVVDGQTIPVSYETVKESVNEILSVTKENKTEEEFKNKLEQTLEKVLIEDNKIEIDDEVKEEVIEEIVEHINDNYDEIYGAVGEITGGGELTDEQFNEIIFTYYDAFLEYMSNNPQGESNN